MRTVFFAFLFCLPCVFGDFISSAVSSKDPAGERQCVAEGRVCDAGGGGPVAGVVVTDGFTVTSTDSRGRYSMYLHPDAEFIYISVPSGWTTVSDRNFAPLFYSPLTPEVKTGKKKRFEADFGIVRDSLQQDRHMFVVWADTQVYEEKELAYISEAAADLRQLASGHPGIRVHAISCGDIVGEWNSEPSLFLPVAKASSESCVPFHYVIGNHDMCMEARSDNGAASVFSGFFGPAYYSWNVGSIHYVVLDNSFFIGRGWQYIGYLDEAQLRWLEQDLSYVQEGSTVVVSMHIPAYSRAARKKDWGKEELNKITCNRNALFKILEPYNAHICSAHEHYAENYVLSDRLFEHVHAPLSGLFWQSLWSCDGVPWGYMVYEADGDDISWYYKPVGDDGKAQYTLYNVGEDPMKPDCVVVNVWNYDPSWKVEWFENGVCKGEMTQFRGWDRTICKDVEERREKEFKWKYIGAGDTEHMFYAKPSSPDSEVTVRVTDRFGRVCSPYTGR